MSNKIESINVNFNIPLLDVRGKRVESRNILNENDVPEDGAEINDLPEGKRLQIITVTLGDSIGTTLIQTKEGLSGKEKLKRAKLSERVFLADGEIEISPSQAELIIKSIDEFGTTTELMRTCELIDPDDKLGLFIV